MSPCSRWAAGKTKEEDVNPLSLLRHNRETVLIIDQGRLRQNQETKRTETGPRERAKRQNQQTERTETEPGHKTTRWNQEMETMETGPGDGKDGGTAVSGPGRVQGVKGVSLPDLNHDSGLELEPSGDPVASNWTPTHQNPSTVDRPTASVHLTRRNKHN